MYRPDQPNPYGSFFDPAFLASAMSGIPNMPMGFGGDMGNVLGQANYMAPNPAVYHMAEIQRQKNLEFIRSANEDDARARSAVAYLEKSGASRAIQAAGGSEAVRRLMGDVLNSQGIAGFIGGQSGSLAVGALALAGSGVRIGADSSFGAGGIQRAAARRIFSAIDNDFFGGGANNLRMTYGLNRDQIGGLMMMGGAQGAFSGLNLGQLNFTNKGQMGFTLDENARQRITEFTKQAAKTMASLVDVFGDRSIGELSQIMQKITGLDLSRMENVQRAGDRIKNIKQAAAAVGVDQRTAFDVIDRGGNLGVSLGLDPRTAKLYSSSIGVDNLLASRMAQSHRAGDWFLPDVSFSERQQMSMRDFAGMLKDPRGERMALLQLLKQQGAISGSDAEGWSRQLETAGLGGLSTVDQALYRKGLSVGTLLKTYGGGAGVMNLLGSAGQEATYGHLGNTMDVNVERRVRNALRRNGLGGQANTLMSLATTLNPDSLSALANAYDSGGDLTAALAGDNYAGSHGAAQFRNLIRGLPQGQASSMLQRTLSFFAADPWGANYRTKASRWESAAQMNAMGGWNVEDAGRLRGFINQGAQGLWDKLANNDPASVLMTMRRYRQGSVLGDPTNPDEQLYLNWSAYAGDMTDEDTAGAAAGKHFVSTFNHLPKDMQVALRAKYIDMGLGYTQNGKTMLDINREGPLAGKDYARMIRTMTDMWGDPELRQRYFADWQEASMGPHGGSLLVRHSVMEEMMHGRFSSMGQAMGRVADRFKGGAGAMEWQKYADILLTGKWTTPHGREINVNSLNQKQLTQLMGHLLDPTALSGLDDESLRIITNQPELRGIAMDRLQKQLNSAQNVVANSTGVFGSTKAYREYETTYNRRDQLRELEARITRLSGDRVSDKQELGGTLRIVDKNNVDIDLRAIIDAYNKGKK